MRGWNLVFKLSFRCLMRNKVFVIVNLMGLSIGMAASLLLFQYVEKEYSYDRFHKNAENIYRIRLDRYNQGELGEHLATASCGLQTILPSKFPEIVNYTVLSNFQLQAVLTYAEKEFSINKAFFASKDFFKVFSYPLITGNTDSALNKPFCIIISGLLAEKLFPGEEPIGKKVRINGRHEFTVTGIIKDLPQNTHLQFDLLISEETMIHLYGSWIRESWYSDVMLTYIQFKDGTDPKAFEQKLNDVVHQIIGKELKAANIDMVFLLQPLTSIHLNSNYPMEADQNGDGEAVTFMLIIALLILIIAWVNYINLSTARTLERAREIGMRKINGATKRNIIWQLLLESVIVNFLGIIISLILVEVLQPWFSEITGMQFDLSLWKKPVFWVVFGIVIIIGSVLSGLYPALILASFKPINVIGRKRLIGNTGNLFRKALLVFQFIISIMLIAGTLTIFRQVEFMKSRNLGIDIDSTYVVNCPVAVDSSWSRKFYGFKDELKSSKMIHEVCASFFVPGDPVWYTQGFVSELDPDNVNSKILNLIFVDEDYMNLYNLKFLAGKNFYRGCRSDTLSFILNRSAASLLGYTNPAEAVGDYLETPSWNFRYKIAGVIEDYHHQSPREKVIPIVFIYHNHPAFIKRFSIRVSGTCNETLDFIEATYKKYFPGNPFEYFHLGNYYNSQYTTDLNFGQTFMIFSFLAIIIAVLGMFALALFFITQRNKEIAIRKALGANSANLLLLLTQNYFSLLLISALIGFPAAFLLMHHWLENFAARITLGWWFFVIPLFLMSMLILFSVSQQIIKTSRINPAEALKYE